MGKNYALTGLIGQALADLEARVVELERKLAALGGKATTDTPEGTLFDGKLVWCRKCGMVTPHERTGNILTSMPPQTEVKCLWCGFTEGVK